MWKKNRTFSSLKPIRSLLPENIKKLIKNKSYTDYDTLKTSWKTVLGEDTAKKCELVKMEKYNRKKCIFLTVDRQHLIEIDYDRDEIIKKIELRKCKTIEDFEKVAVKHGYKKGWGYHQWKLRNKK